MGGVVFDVEVSYAVGRESVGRVSDVVDSLGVAIFVFVRGAVVGCDAVLVAVFRGGAAGVMLCSLRLVLSVVGGFDEGFNSVFLLFDWDYFGYVGRVDGRAVVGLIDELVAGDVDEVEVGVGCEV